MKSNLEKNKSQETKELIANEELVIQANDDIKQKLKDEEEKHWKFINERMKLDEDFKRKTAQKEDDTTFSDEQDKILAELKEKIDEAQKTFEEQNTALDEQKKLNKLEEKKQRDYQMKN